MPERRPPRASSKKDLRKLATYLNARTDHRFRRGKGKVGRREEQWRARLYVFALALAAVVLWGLWREFF